MKSKALFPVLLAFAGALTPGCSKESPEVTPEEVIGQQVTLSTTVSLAGTKALDADGHKTFKAGDQIAVVYKNQSSETVKAVSEALPAGDYGKSASFTVTLTSPLESGSLTIISPAFMAKADGSVNYDALASQDGTLATLGDKLDLAMYEGSLTADAELPESISLTNRLVVCAFTLKDSEGSNEITGSITSLHIKAGDDSYCVGRTAASGPVYVAIRPVEGADLLFTAASSAGVYYVKALTGKTYEANNLYPLGLRMMERPQAQFSVSGEKKVCFSPGNLQATTADKGGSWVWSFAPSQFAFIGNAGANAALKTDGSVVANGTVDLFGWSTSATNYGIHGSNANSVYSGNFRDWGDLVDGGWRTLSADEWNYVLNYRDNCFAKAQVSGQDGIILLPDGWDTSWCSSLIVDDYSGSSFSLNVVSLSDWVSAFEAHGAVFLPAAGYRSTSSSQSEVDFDQHGYWSASGDGDNKAKLFYFSATSMTAIQSTDRSTGYSVRLVKDAD